MSADATPTVIKINAITVPEDAGDELARRFAARAHAVDDQDGFEGFELLRPTDERRQWLVVTRWRDESSFQKWVSSPAFAHGHAGADRPSPHGGPVSVSSELWSYEVAGGSGTGVSEPARGAAEDEASTGRDHRVVARRRGRAGRQHLAPVPARPRRRSAAPTRSGCSWRAATIPPYATNGSVIPVKGSRRTTPAMMKKA